VKLSTMQGQIMGVLETRAVTAKQLAEELGYNAGAIRTALNNLQSLGLATQTRVSRQESIWRKPS
jgi:predicted ArsR family transcriptional regulator